MSAAGARTGARLVVRIVCAFNGICAVACGFFMMAGAAGALPSSLDSAFALFNDMVPVIRRLPLPEFMAVNLFWPGLALALVNGVANLVASWLFLRRREALARRWALAAGVLLIGWCAFELAYLPNPVSVAYLVVGIVQTVCAGAMRPAR